MTVPTDRTSSTIQSQKHLIGRIVDSGGWASPRLAEYVQ